jgi:hypothetical protein
MPSAYGSFCPSHVLAQVRIGSNVVALFPDPRGYVKLMFTMRVIRLDRAKQQVQGVVLNMTRGLPFREGDEVEIPMKDLRAIAVH